MILEYTLNGSVRKTTIRSGDRLVDILRKEPDASSLLPDCLSGRCGRCLVFMDGRLCFSCLVPAFKARGSEISTFEALEKTEDFTEIEQALEHEHCMPCRFCRAAKIMALADLLDRISSPEPSQILEQLDMVQCSCTDPDSLKRAAFKAMELRNKRKFGREVK